MATTYQLNQPTPITILAKSSSGGHYNVEFSVINNHIRVFCNCAAGVVRHLCKHKLGLIQGDKSFLYDPSQAHCLDEIRSWPGFQSLLERIALYESSLREIQKKKRAVEADEKRLRDVFASELDSGFVMDQTDWAWQIPSPLLPKDEVLSEASILDYRPHDVFHKKDGTESIHIQDVRKVVYLKLRYTLYSIKDGRYTPQGDFEATAIDMIQQLKNGPMRKTDVQ